MTITHAWATTMMKRMKRDVEAPSMQSAGTREEIEKKK
jgi:hypothetical protein